MSMNKYLSIITFNVNGLNAPIKGHGVAEWIRNHDPHICCLLEPYIRKKIPMHTEREGLGKNTPNKWQEKKSWGSNPYIRQNRLQNKCHKKTHRGTLHNTQGKNPIRDINIVNICTQ